MQHSKVEIISVKILLWANLQLSSSFFCDVGSADCSVGRSVGYKLDRPVAPVGHPVKEIYFYSVQTWVDSTQPPILCNYGSFPRFKEAWAWSWLPTFKVKGGGAIPPLPHTSSWLSALSDIWLPPDSSWIKTGSEISFSPPSTSSLTLFSLPKFFFFNYLMFCTFPSTLFVISCFSFLFLAGAIRWYFRDVSEKHVVSLFRFGDYNPSKKETASTALWRRRHFVSSKLLQEYTVPHSRLQKRSYTLLK
jgi:hypothetical protein